MLAVRRIDAGFGRWEELRALLLEAFAYMAGRIDPPSSVLSLTADDIARQTREGCVFIAEEDGRLVGSVFARATADAFYLGKLAVRPGRQGRGIGRALVAVVEAEALRRGFQVLELQTRIELTENHAAFARLGFIKTGETTHPGYPRATSITMRRRLSAAPAA
jgi:predicted N-acetyltransferase YhbS